jgi:hypothetical protein
MRTSTVLAVLWSILLAFASERAWASGDSCAGPASFDPATGIMTCGAGCPPGFQCRAWMMPMQPPTPQHAYDVVCRCILWDGQTWQVLAVVPDTCGLAVEYDQNSYPTGFHCENYQCHSSCVKQYTPVWECNCP